MDIDMEGFQNSLSVVFSNSQSNVFPSFPNNPNSISNKLSSISLDGKRNRQDIHIDANKSARMDTEVAVNAEEKNMRNSGDKFRIPVVLAWINQSGISCTRNVNSLIDIHRQLLPQTRFLESFLEIRPQFSVSGIEASFHRTSFSLRFHWCPWISSPSTLC